MSRSEMGSWARRWGPLIVPWMVVAFGIAVISTFTTTTDEFKNVAEGLAVFAAAGYFFQRAVFGYFIVNLSLEVTVQRANETTRDLLAVVAALEKGDRGTLALHDVVIRVTPEGGIPIVRQPEVQRFSFSSQDVNGTKKVRHVVNLSKTSASIPLLNLTPGERFAVSGYVDVPKGKPCLVEVVVLGESIGTGKIAQWRSSTVSMPSDGSTVAAPSDFTCSL